MHNNEDGEKINFISKIIISVKNFEYYILLAAEKNYKAISYLTKLILIFSLILSIAYISKFITIVNSVTRYISENIEEINYNSEILEVKTKDNIEIENENNFLQLIIVDTGEENTEEHTAKLNLYESGIIILKDRAILKTKIDNGQTSYNYSQFNIGNFNKDELLSIFSSNQIYYSYAILFVAIFIYLFLFYFVQTFIDAIFLAVLGYFVARINRMRIKFSATFNIGIYALTLPIILNLIYIIINLLTGIEIKYFDWMYTAISYVYVVVAILMIKADFIDKHMEMMRINEEKEKEKQNEDEIIEDEEKSKEKNEKKDKKEKDKDNNLEEPEDPAMQE